MENEMNELVQLFQQAFFSKNNEERKESEQRLTKKCLDNQRTLEYILNIILQTNQQDLIRETAAVFIPTLIKKYFTSPISYTIDMQKQHLEYLVQTLKSNQINTKIKNHLSIALSNLLMYDRKGELQGPLKQHCMELFQVNDLVILEGGLYVFQALVQSLDLTMLNLDVQNEYEWIEKFISKGSEIANALKQQDQNNGGIRLQILQLYKNWCSSVYELCKKLQKKYGLQRNSGINQLGNFLSNSKQLCESLFECLFLEKNTSEKNILINTNNQSIDNLMNESKIQVLGAYNYLVNFTLNEKTKVQMKQSAVYVQLNNLLPLILVNLIKWVTDSNFNVNQVIENDFHSRLINNMIKFVTSCGNQSEFYQIFFEAKTTLLFDVIYPFICTTQKEKQQMLDQPEEFVNLALDTVDKQTSDIPKTSVATMLEMICDHIDGSTSFIAQMALLVINHAIQTHDNNQEVDNLNNPFYLLKDLKSRYILLKMTPEQRIDSSLIILTVMSYLLSRRQDLIKILEEMLTNNSTFFTNCSHIISCRLSLFIGYYCDNLFKTDTSLPKLIQYFQILINFLKTNQQAVIYQTIDALKNLFEDEELHPKLENLVPDVFYTLCDSLLESKYDQHFDMIVSILKLYFKHININHIQYLLDILVKRVLSDQAKIEQGAKEEQLWINKSWNIIRALVEIENAYIPQYLNEIEQKLFPLYGCLEKPQNLEFDEDIIMFVTSIIENTKQITEPQKQLLLLCPLVLNKQNNRLGSMYELFNLYLSYGAHIFQDLTLQKIFFEMCFNAMTCSGDVSNEADQGEAILLIQLAIQMLQSSINEQNLRNILQVVYTDQTNQDFIKSRKLGVFLSALLFDFERTKQQLNEIGLLQDLFQNLISNVYEEGYDIKLFIITMCTLLNKNVDVFSIQLIDTITQLLYKQQVYETKKSQKKMLQEEDDDDDFFNDDDSESLLNEVKQEAKLSYENFKSPILKEDEYQIFQSCIMNIKQNSPEKIQQLKENLSQEKIQYLQEIMLIKRIDGQDPRKVQIYRQLIKSNLQIVKAGKRKQK